jgi:hypothetical protein
MTVMPDIERSFLRKLTLPDVLFAGLVLLFVLLSWSASRQESVTIDEFRHLSTGIHYWQSGDFSFDAATPPLWKMAMALPAYLSGAEAVKFRELPEIIAGWEPWMVATDFMRDNAAAYDRYLQAARMVNLLAAAGCLILLYRRCSRHYGPNAALAGTSLLAFSPTFLAHSHYATTDIIATLTIAAVVFLLLDYLHKPTLIRLSGAALLFSLSLLCKYTALLVSPLLLLAPLLVAIRRAGGVAAVRQGLPAVLLMAKSVLLIMVIVLLTVNLFYGFKGTGTLLEQIPLGSRALSALGQSAAGALPIPFPRAFVEGFDRQKSDSDYSETSAYLLGRWSAEGFRSYYLAAFCLKETIPFLLMLAAALLYLVRRRGCPLPGQDLLIICYVPLILFIVLSFMNRLNVGVRYLLPAYPFFCLIIAGFIDSCRGRHGVRIVLLLLFVLHAASLLRVAPHYTSYFNELSGGPVNGYRYLIDSNIDWGQDLPSLKKYMAEHGIENIQLAYFGHGLPEIYGIRYEPLTLPPKPGYVAISVSLLQGHPYLLTYTVPPQIAEFDRFQSLRRLQPVARAGYSILIYRVD